MTPVKGESSSARKGKEIAIDDPPTKIVSEDAPLFESKLFEEEEGGCDLNSKCARLIDLWYDTHIHFLVVPGDYLPPPPGRVWLSICYCDTEVS